MVKFCGWVIALLAACPLAGTDRAGWSFDTGLSPEQAADLLATLPKAPEGSWLRLRGMAQSAVIDAQGKEEPLYSLANPPVPVAERRVALQRLRAQGYRLVALVGWDEGTWRQGVRDPRSLRQLPLDLREAFERGRLLAATYGDLIDYWEIGNEPDISFVEENPETYAAYLKACYLGVRRGCAVLSGKRQAVSDKREGQGAESKGARAKGEALNGQPLPLGALPPATNVSLVLMAPLALPPGPWLEAFASNDGLRYTDGFNYHYYGYAEDFTGVYGQFRDAVAKSPSVKREAAGSKPGSPAFAQGASARQKELEDTDSVFASNFYPDAEGWAAKRVASFGFPPPAASPTRTLLEKRPLASGEPALVPQGRWLVSPGVTVEETTEGWRFHVTTWAPEPMRPAMAELPLPPGWRADQDALLTFEYRLLPAGGGRQAMGDGQRTEEARGLKSDTGNRKPETLPQNPKLKTQNSKPNVDPPGLDGNVTERSSPGRERGSTRELPVFLTEYGYGLLSKEAWITAEGRERQRSWFAAVGKQIHGLNIEGAMAFLLTPYLERDVSEFGLLMNGSGAKSEAPGDKRKAVSGKLETEAQGTEKSELKTQNSKLKTQGAAAAPWGGYKVSPALAALLDQDSQQPEPRTQNPEPRTQCAALAPPSPVVVDFVAGQGLAQAKTSGGYFLQGSHDRGQPAEGLLVIYNFSDRPARGELLLEGDAWTLAGGNRQMTIALAPNDRREFSVRINAAATRYEPMAVRARWQESPAMPPPSTTVTVESNPAAVAGQTPPAAVTRPAGLVPKRVRPDTPERKETFEMYFRTLNGNLYGTWPRLTATGQWARYMERMGNFSMAFYGRANPPWRFEDNQPAALVFFLRPTELPATFEIRWAQVVKFAAPK